MARIRINTRTHTKEKPYLINSYFFSKLVRQKKVNRVSKIRVCRWLKNVESRSKIALFSNERHSEIWFPNRTITFFWSKLSKLHKKDPILHMATNRPTTFSLKQGETRTSHGPIPHPLIPINDVLVAIFMVQGQGKFKIMKILRASCIFSPFDPTQVLGLPHGITCLHSLVLSHTHTHTHTHPPPHTHTPHPPTHAHNIHAVLVCHTYQSNCIGTQRIMGE